MWEFLRQLSGDGLPIHTDPADESPELGNDLWLRVQCSFQLVHLMWRQPEDPVLG